MKYTSEQKYIAFKYLVARCALDTLEIICELGSLDEKPELQQNYPTGHELKILGFSEPTQVVGPDAHWPNNYEIMERCRAILFEECHCISK